VSCCTARPHALVPSLCDLMHASPTVRARCRIQQSNKR
jgi:hypothetical protein